MSIAKSVNNGSQKVISVTNNLFDLFWGDGWENWARFKWDKETKAFIVLNKSKHLPHQFVTSLNMAKENMK